MHARDSIPEHFVRFILLVLFWTGTHVDAAEPISSDPIRPPAISVEEVPLIAPALVDRLRQYQAIRIAGFQGWSPDGKGVLIATRFGDTAQLHHVAFPGARREQLTFQAEPVSGRYVPRSTDGRILLSMSQGGNENDQIYLLNRSTGKPVIFTDGKSRNLLGPIRKDGSQFIVHSSQRNGRDMDIYVADVSNPGQLKLIYEAQNELWQALDWSANGGKLLVRKYISINESTPAIFDLATGKIEPLALPGNGPAAVGTMRFSPDGQVAFITTDVRGEFLELARVELATNRWTWLTADIPWDVAEVEVDSRSGKIAIVTNEDGASGLYQFAGKKRERLEIPLGTASGLEYSPDSEHLGFTLNQPNAPGDVYSLQLASKKLTQWSFSEAGGLRPETFVTANRIQFSSFDGKQIPAYYFRPRSANNAQKAAVVINIHGGPESQYRPAFSGLDQFYCNELGIAVIHPNVRGSAGYGKSYLKLDNGMKREDSVKDIGALLDWIAQQPELDAERVAVMGGSYGGYMVLASLTNFPGRIRAGVDSVGIASFRSFLKNTSAYRQDLRRVEYGDERDPAMVSFFEKIDPLENAHKIQSELLVLHGKNDPRVPFSEAVQIVAKVREQGRKVWTVYADNEGHGFAKKPNRDYQAAVIATFLKSALIESEVKP